MNEEKTIPEPDREFYLIPTGEQATEQGTPLGELFEVRSKLDMVQDGTMKGKANE